MQRGPNKVPVFALVVITLISLLFVFIGKVNTLGPIVTMPFMLTYAAVDYAYFALAMSYESKQKRRERLEGGELLLKDSSNGEASSSGAKGYGSMHNGYRKLDGSQDLDSLFPERTQYDDRRRAPNSERPVATQQNGSPAQPQDADGSRDVSTSLAVTDNSDTAELISGKRRRDLLMEYSQNMIV